MDYAIKGKYTFRGEEHSQVGLITVDDVTEAITGFIMDPSSSSPRHEVIGQVSYKGVKIILDFMYKNLWLNPLLIFTNLHHTPQPTSLRITAAPLAKSILYISTKGQGKPDKASKS